MAEISITFKAHGGYDAPWVVIKAGSVSEASGIISEMRTPDGDTGVTPFQAVRIVADEFTAGVPTPAQAVAAVQSAMPGTTVVSEGPATPPAQSYPPCETCGKPTDWREGLGANGKWGGYICSSGDRTHFKKTIG